jgi:hypothetical protein
VISCFPPPPALLLLLPRQVKSTVDLVAFRLSSAHNNPTNQTQTYRALHRAKSRSTQEEAHPTTQQVQGPQRERERERRRGRKSNCSGQSRARILSHVSRTQFEKFPEIYGNTETCRARTSERRSQEKQQQQQKKS